MCIVSFLILHFPLVIAFLLINSFFFEGAPLFTDSRYKFSHLYKCACLQDFSFSRTGLGLWPGSLSLGLPPLGPGGTLGRWEPLAPCFALCTLTGTLHALREKRGRRPIQVSVLTRAHAARAWSSLYQSLDFQSCIKYISEAQILMSNQHKKQSNQ